MRPPSLNPRTRGRALLYIAPPIRECDTQRGPCLALGAFVAFHASGRRIDEAHKTGHLDGPGYMCHHTARTQLPSDVSNSAAQPLAGA